MPTTPEMRSSAWSVGCVIAETIGVQVVKLVRRVPQYLAMRCRSCGARWMVRVNRNGTPPRGWRKCPGDHKCNAYRLSNNGRYR